MSRSGWVLMGAIAAVAALGSAVASSSPDGLERVAADLAFASRATTTLEAPLPDYTVPGSGRLSGSLAGILGAAVVGGGAFAAGRLLRRRSS